MAKAKTLDRLELTRRKFAHAKEHSENTTPHKTLSEITGLPPLSNLTVCPECGSESVIHESGCERCLTCGWSACK